VVRERSREDKRVIHLRLTERGKAAYYHHENFHRQMIKSMTAEMNEQETDVLIYALAKLVDYFHLKYFDSPEILA
jgi:DNA-binding MarR family transcriptional regulator